MTFFFKTKKVMSGFICGHCNKRFTKKYNLIRHIKCKHHGIEINIRKSPAQVLRCIVSGCDTSFTQKKTMYAHCRSKHSHLMDHLPIPVKITKGNDKEREADERKKKLSGRCIDDFPLLRVIFHSSSSSFFF